MTATKNSDKRVEEGEECCNSREGEDRGQGKENEDEHKVDQFCFGCKSSLAKSPELINITGQTRHRWHPECFKCMSCREPMDKRQSCHVYKDQILCRTDYLRLKRDHSIKCKRCQWPIGASDWVRRAADYVYHLACFNCDICFRQLNTGEQYVINLQSDSSDGRASENCEQQQQTVVRLMCKLHFTVEGGRRSASRPDEGAAPLETGAISPDPTNKTAGKLESSIKSSHSKQRRHQAPLKSDQFHLLAPPTEPPVCSSSIINASGLAQISAINQSQQLQQISTPLPAGSAAMTGRQHSMSKDYSLMASPTTSNLILDDSFMTIGNRRIPSSSSTASSSSTSSTSSLASASAAVANFTSGRLTPSSSGGGNGSGIQSKSKRVRTTFTEDQLSILQTHFQIDSNPDGQDLERIATITGLSKRVTQVWFQNSRARQKKYMIKRRPGSHGSSGGSGGGGGGMSALGHPHGHGGQRHQNSVHQSLALIGQSLSSPAGVSGSPNLEVGEHTGDLRTPPASRNPMRFQASTPFDSLAQHQFRENSSFQASGGTSKSPSRSLNDKERSHEMRRDNHERTSILLRSNEDDDEEMSESVSDDDDEYEQLHESRLASPGLSERAGVTPDRIQSDGRSDAQ